MSGSFSSCPCRGCEDRVMGCHTVCLKYQIFKQGKDEERKKRNEYKKIESLQRDITNEARKKAMR